MNKCFAVFLAMIASWQLRADEPAQIMLIGTFHFSNPGRDTVKVGDFDVLSTESQAWLQAFAQRLADFKPTQVLLEYNPDNEELMNQRYADYLDGNYELEVNEVYQLGFRIAKLSGLKTVKSFDHRDLNWNAEPMFEYAGQHDSPELKVFNQIIENVTVDQNRAMQTMNLGELMRYYNDPMQDRINMDLYLATNAIGAGDGWSGADATASWWQRNFRMYANIQKAAHPGNRIIVIGGQGHTAILNTLLATDMRLQAVSVAGYFP
jgi:hypothetical protein